MIFSIREAYIDNTRNRESRTPVIAREIKVPESGNSPTLLDSGFFRNDE